MSPPPPPPPKTNNHHSDTTTSKSQSAKEEEKEEEKATKEEEEKVAKNNDEHNSDDFLHKISSSHQKELETCTALPTLGRNQSMFDERNFTGMQSLKLSGNSTTTVSDSKGGIGRTRNDITSNRSGPSSSVLEMLAEEEHEADVERDDFNASGTTGVDSLRSYTSTNTTTSQNSTASNASTVVSDFLQARVDTFTNNTRKMSTTFFKNMDTIADRWKNKKKDTPTENNKKKQNSNNNILNNIQE